jgi:hypothetical protein
MNFEWINGLVFVGRIYRKAYSSNGSFMKFPAKSLSTFFDPMDDPVKNLQCVYTGDIPFVSTGVMTNMASYGGFKRWLNTGGSKEKRL